MQIISWRSLYYFFSSWFVLLSVFGEIDSNRPIITFAPIVCGIYFLSYHLYLCNFFTFVFCRYTSKFDKVELDKIVEVVSDLPDPVVCCFEKYFSFFLFVEDVPFIMIHFLFLCLLSCSLIHLLRKLLMLPMTIFMHFILLRSRLRKVLRK